MKRQSLASQSAVNRRDAARGAGQSGGQSLVGLGDSEILLAFFLVIWWTGGMAVHLFDSALAGLPAEAPLLAAVTLRLIQDGERERFDAELTTKHHLKNATAVG